MKYIVTGDWHLRTDSPRCRVDEDWMETQRRAVEFILDTAQRMGAAIIITGDVFHRSISSVSLLNFILSILRKSDVPIYAIPGNHDLPGHNMENMDECAYGILDKSGVFWDWENDGRNMVMFPFGTEDPRLTDGVDIVVLHKLILPEDPGFDMGQTSAHKVLSDFPDAKWIFTGDYHSNFFAVSPEGNRRLVNPGCLLRQSASQKDYTQIVYMVDTESSDILEIPVPDPKEMVVADYILEEKEKDERLQAFVSQVKEGVGIGLSFEDNLESYYKERAQDGDPVPEEIKLIIEEVI